jgi:hypothetical protein
MYTEFLWTETLVELEFGGPRSIYDNNITKDVWEVSFEDVT